MANVLIQGSGGGGQKLAPLTTPATADKVKSGKELYDASGTKITGTFNATLPTLNAPTITVSGNVVNIVDGDNGNFSKTWEIRINNLPYRIIAHTGNYTFTELSDGTYSVKVCARGDGFNDSAFSNVETMTISTSSPIYGVSGLADSTTTLTRTDDAVGKSWTMSNNEISSDFDSVFPYNQMTRETIDGNVFVKIPAIYWRVGYDSENRITDIAVSQSPIEASTGQVAYQSEAFYYGAYLGSVDANNKLLSASGATQTGNQTRATFRTYATNNGTGYQLIDLYHQRIIQFLWLIEFGTKDSQSIMYGYTSSGGTTGATDNLTTPSGQLAAKDRMRYRYIEDFVGNGYTFLDGIAAYYVSANPADYSEDMSATGIAFTVTEGNLTPGNNRYGCVRALGIVDINNPILSPVTWGSPNSSYNTYFCDEFNFANANPAVYIGSLNDGANRGVFYMRGMTATYTYSAMGGRLLYVPTT